MTPTLSIIIPTHDHPRRTLLLKEVFDTIITQGLVPGDEVLVVGDTRKGPLPAAEALVEAYGPFFHYYEVNTGRPSGGHDQINYALDIATSDYIVWHDSDDPFYEGAFDAIRTHIARLEKPTPIIFRYYNTQLWPHILWEHKEIVEGRIGGPIFVAPNIKEKLGRATVRYAGDFDYIKSTMEHYDTVEWDEFVIAQAGNADPQSKNYPGAQ